MSRDAADGDVHKQVWGLLPWFVNGSLSPEERQTVESHLAECTPCRLEREVQARIRSAARRDEAVAISPDAAFQKLMARIDAADIRGRRRQRAQPWVQWLVAAVVVESIALVAWAAWAFSGAHPETSADAQYVTLSDANANPAARGDSLVRVVFASQTTLADFQSLLRSVEGHVVDGPTRAGVYTIALDPAARSAADRVSALRESSHVRFVEQVHTTVSPQP